MAGGMLLVFELGGEPHALPASDILKVVDPGPITPLPLLPAAIRGITHHRGGIVTVVDLAVLLYPEQVEQAAPGPGGVERPGRLILVEGRGAAGRTLGFLVADVREIVTADPSTGAPPGRAGTAVVSLLAHGHRPLQVLSTERVLQLVGKLAGADYATAPRQRGAVPQGSN